MDAALITVRTGGKWLAMMLAALVLAGCVTQKIDWPARVGNYTHDQAVTELGPPDKSAKLTDGTVVADWLTHRPDHCRAGTLLCAARLLFWPAHAQVHRNLRARPLFAADLRRGRQIENLEGIGR